MLFCPDGSRRSADSLGALLPCSQLPWVSSTFASIAHLRGGRPAFSWKTMVERQACSLMWVHPRTRSNQVTHLFLQSVTNADAKPNLRQEKKHLRGLLRYPHARVNILLPGRLCSWSQETMRQVLLDCVLRSLR
jgi:hypothetical protein